MKKQFIKVQWLIGGAFICSFLVLLTLRLDLFRQDVQKDVQRDVLARPASIMEGESWRVITREGQRIGYTRRQLSLGSSGYNLEEEVFMRLNQLGVVQDLKTKLEAALNEDGTVSSFSLRLNSGIFQYSLQGTVEAGQLDLLAGTPADMRKMILPITQRPYLASSLVDKLGSFSWQEGQSRSFPLFEPSLPALKQALVTYRGRDNILVGGRTQGVSRYLLEFAGVKQDAWIGDDGRVLKESGLLGISIEAATRQEAKRDFPADAGGDLVAAASILADREIENPTALRRLVVRLLNLPPGAISLTGGRQVTRNGTLIIEKESLIGIRPAELKRADREKLLMATPQIQSDHPLIIETLAKIISPGDQALVQAKKITAWVDKNIEKKPVISFPNALETLTNRRGDCNEQAALLAALGRAAGIPTAVEAGLVYLRGRFYYHAWNAFYLDGWITADATLGQLPADVTHIRLVRDEGAGLAALLPVMGSLRIEIVETTR